MKRREAGFTLVEAIITMAVVGLLMAIAVPSFRNLILSSRRATVTNEVLGAMQMARSEALKRGTMVSVCPSTNGTTCSATITDWKSGWLMFAKGSGTTPCTVETGGTIPDTILKYTGNENEGITVKSDQQCYAFRSFNVNIAAGSNGVLTICDPDAGSDASRRYGVEFALGRPRVTRNPSLVCP